MKFLYLLSLSFYFIKASKICNILSFSGGGSFGAIEVGILDKIKLSEYDMITGISAGALNAGLLSYYNNPLLLNKGIEKLKYIYINLTNNDVYTHNYFEIEKYWSYYSTLPLKKTLIQNLLSINYLDQSKITLIGSTNLNTGKLDIFNFEKYSQLDQVEILLASSAIPILFEPIKFNNNIYVDGGTISNEILIGFNEYLPMCNNYNITFISSNKDIEFKQDINNFSDYIKRLKDVFNFNFNNQLNNINILPCPNKRRGLLYHYFPTFNLSNYSSLDFNNGEKLINLGQIEYSYKIYDYC